MPIDKKHVVHLENGRLKETSAADVDALFAAFSADPNKDRLVVHFHGGLVSKAGGLEIAERLQPKYSAAGGYPVFFVWESAWHETLLNNLGEIVGEDFFKALLKRVAGKVMEKLDVDETGTRGLGLSPTQLEMELGRADRGAEPFSRVDPGSLLDAGATLSPAEEAAFTQELEQDPDFGRAVDAIVQQIDAAPPGIAARSLASGTTHLSPDVLAQVRAEKDPAAAARAIGIPLRLIKGAVVILVKVIARFALKRDHGVHATVVEEILREFYAGDLLKQVWHLMKKDTADAFGPDARRFGGTAMLAGIKALAATGRTPRILLVGHSTGAVYICNWLRAADEMLPPGVKFEVVFLAPACTVQLFARTLEAHGGRISKFRMFAMKDELEKKDPMLSGMKLLYPRSLLYFISGVLEEKSDVPVAGMQRFYSGARPFDPARYPEIGRVLQFLGATPDSRVWSTQSGMPGRNSDSARHVDFDDRTTVESLEFIIGNGF
jgi:hypothetical protein